MKFRNKIYPAFLFPFSIYIYIYIYIVFIDVVIQTVCIFCILHILNLRPINHYLSFNALCCELKYACDFMFFVSSTTSN